MTLTFVPEDRRHLPRPLGGDLPFIYATLERADRPYLRPDRERDGMIRAVPAARCPWRLRAARAACAGGRRLAGLLQSPSRPSAARRPGQARRSRQRLPRAKSCGPRIRYDIPRNLLLGDRAAGGRDQPRRPVHGLALDRQRQRRGAVLRQRRRHRRLDPRSAGAWDHLDRRRLHAGQSALAPRRLRLARAGLRPGAATSITRPGC